jgi:hypothetical protein
VQRNVELPFAARVPLVISQHVGAAILGVFTGAVAIVLFCFAMYHLTLIAKNITTYEEYKWDRYQGTARKAVLFVSRTRVAHGLAPSHTLRTVEACRAVAADTRRAFGIVDGDAKSGVTLSPDAPVKFALDDAALAKLDESLFALERYNPQVAHAYSRGWRQNFREVFLPTKMKTHTQ